MWQTIGQSKALDLLQRALAKGVLSHAYLLIGPPQVGKMTLARELAMVLNCRAPADRKPCGECPACLKIAADKHADVRIISLDSVQPAEENKEKQATVIGIEAVSDLLYSASLPPFEGNRRVYIIDEAANLSLDAANRLLKTLEEPPAGVVFLLLTSNIRLIPITIISRCQRLELSRVKTEEIEKMLIDRRQVEPEKARILARLSRGCPGWAVEAVGNAALLPERREMFDKMQVVMRSDSTERFSVAAQLALQFGKKRETVYETLDTWASWWRDILLVKTGCTGDIVSFDYQSDLTAMAGAYSLAGIKESIKGILDASAQLKLNANARLVLESLMLNLPHPSQTINGRG